MSVPLVEADLVRGRRVTSWPPSKPVRRRPPRSGSRVRETDPSLRKWPEMQPQFCEIGAKR
jgi:hypothetical protein